MSQPRGAQVSGKRNPSKEKEEEKESTFQWVDNGVRLLLEVTKAYKTEKEGESVYLECIRKKYEEI